MNHTQNLNALPREVLREIVRKSWEDLSQFQWFGTPFAWLDVECTQKSPALRANDFGLWVFSQPDDPFVITREVLVRLHRACVEAETWLAVQFGDQS